MAKSLRQHVKDEPVLAAVVSSIAAALVWFGVTPDQDLVNGALDAASLVTMVVTFLRARNKVTPNHKADK